MCTGVSSRQLGKGFGTWARARAETDGLGVGRSLDSLGLLDVRVAWL